MNTTFAHITFPNQWLKKLLTMVLLVACLFRFLGFDKGVEQDFFAKGHPKYFSSYKTTAHLVFLDFVADDEEGEGDDDEISFHLFDFSHTAIAPSALLGIATLAATQYKPDFHFTLSHVPLFLRNRNIRI